MASIADARRLIELDLGLATLSAIRADGSVQLTVVNAGVVEHPVCGKDVAGFVARGSTRKIDHLRINPRAALLWRAGWAWVTVEGHAELYGPNDGIDRLDHEGQRLLFHSIVQSTGIEPEDWEEYDRVVKAEGRTAVLLTPTRIYQNP